MISIKNLHKSYPIGQSSLHALKGISFDINDGELVSVMGSSGSGKSTLLNIIGLLDSYDNGTYYLNDLLMENLSETKAAYYRNKYFGFV
ncbi:MAG TPA: ATP-binding cassette domain-containing protein, partial [Salinivirgaceae bacterium]|nr:ATP-binding cassette domain-containing protein [Salinivirgaceae bacterium]